MAKRKATTIGAADATPKQDGELSLLNPEEILSLKIKKRDQFGPWKVNRSEQVLVHEKYHYEIDLEEIKTCAQLADWIFQITAKSWATNNDLGWLLRALEQELQPQARMCSYGIEQHKSKR